MIEGRFANLRGKFWPTNGFDLLGLSRRKLAA
jgi:hypothetical protein